MKVNKWKNSLLFHLVTCHTICCLALLCSLLLYTPEYTNNAIEYFMVKNNHFVLQSFLKARNLNCGQAELCCWEQSGSASLPWLSLALLQWEDK